jgi:hypothetical protein
VAVVVVDILAAAAGSLVAVAVVDNCKSLAAAAADLDLQEIIHCIIFTDKADFSLLKL